MTEYELRKAHADIGAVWRFYKYYVQKEPKNDQFYHDLAEDADDTGRKMLTTLGRKCLRAAIAAISEDDAKEKK